MLFPILVAVLVAAIAVSGVVLVQAFIKNIEETERAQMRAIAELARSSGGSVTPLSVAEHLQITALDADRLLRDMVDDEHLTMAIDETEGMLVFEFPKLVSARRASTINR